MSEFQPDEPTTVSEPVTVEVETPAPDSTTDSEPEPVTVEVQTPAPAQAPVEVSASVSELDERRYKLIRENMELAVRSVEQLGRQLDQLFRAATPIFAELKETTELLQQVIGEQDEQVEKLGKCSAAIVQATAQLDAITQRHNQH